jgi:hypothetical protein
MGMQNAQYVFVGPNLGRSVSCLAGFGVEDARL